MSQWITRTDQKFKVGDRIKLGGREGVIYAIDEISSNSFEVRWNNGQYGNLPSIHSFPDLQILAPEPSLTQEAMDEIMRCASQDMYLLDGQRLILTNKLFSMVKRIEK